MGHFFWDTLYCSLFWAVQRKSRILFWALFWVDHSQEHFFELITHKSTFLSALLINETFLNTFLRTQKSGFALKSVFLSEFALLRAFLSAQKSTQGPTEPLWLLSKKCRKSHLRTSNCSGCLDWGVDWGFRHCLDFGNFWSGIPSLKETCCCRLSQTCWIQN